MVETTPAFRGRVDSDQSGIRQTLCHLKRWSNALFGKLFDNPSGIWKNRMQCVVETLLGVLCRVRGALGTR
jgi:hypothetical protein